MTSIEDEIRDKLAEHLELIEDGLKLIKVNYYLPNANGARGFVDILAQSRNGTFVAIEVKRSNKTAREALHEVLKYKELLEAELGVEAADVASMIVSTDWKELITPFTRLRRSWDTSIRGFELKLDGESTTPIRATEVIPPAEPPRERGVSPVHVLFTVPDNSDVIQDLWSRVVKEMPKVGVDDLIGLTVRHTELPVGLYVALGRALKDDPRTAALDYLKETFPDDSIEAPEGFVLEYRAMDHLLDQLSGQYHFELFYPERLLSVIDLGNWQVDAVWRHGIFLRQIDLYPDDQVLDRLTDSSGQIMQRTSGSARKGHRAAWTRARKRLTDSLASSADWSAIVNLWLDEIENDKNDAELAYSTYNLGDFLTTIVYGWPDQLALFTPQLELVVQPGNDLSRILTGTLVWDGTCEKDILGIVRGIYATPADWQWKSPAEPQFDDRELLRQLGLSYKCFEFYEGESRLPAICEVSDGSTALVRTPTVEQQPEWPGIQPFPEFLRQYANQIEQLAGHYRSHMFIDVSAGYQIVTQFRQSPD